MTPDQLARIFDLDLWHAGQPGLDEQFDADRFGVWLEVLVESGATVAAQKLAGMDVDLVSAGLARHARVYDIAAVTPYTTTDGEEAAAILSIDDGLACDVGGYRVVARRTDSWDAIVAVLLSLDAEHHDYFHQVMRGCRALSNSRPEVDGLDDLFGVGDQVMFDLAVDRERRREKQGYATPAQARAFLQMSRRLRLEHDAMPPANPVARAYFRAIDEEHSYGRPQHTRAFAGGIRGAGCSGGLRRGGCCSLRGTPRGRYPRTAASSATEWIAGSRRASRAHPGAHAVRPRL